MQGSSSSSVSLFSLAASESQIAAGSQEVGLKAAARGGWRLGEAGHMLLCLLRTRHRKTRKGGFQGEASTVQGSWGRQEQLSRVGR